MIEISRTMDRPAAVVWHLLSTPSAWPRWGLSIRRASGPEPLHRGANGTVKTVLGVTLPFIITDFDETAMTWSWRVAGVPATAHRVERRDAVSRVVIGIPTWAAPYSAVVWWSLRRLDRAASTRS